MESRQNNFLARFVKLGFCCKATPCLPSLFSSTSMSFRKRNVALSSSSKNEENASANSTKKSQLPGVRPSTIDGRPVTSTGTSTLDGLLAGHGGLALGCSLLIEEIGTTDYAGALLKFFAAEGLLQGHHVHVVGYPEQWARELPNCVEGSDSKESKDGTSGKMKIAWRYESLGQFGSGPSLRGRDFQMVRYGIASFATPRTKAPCPQCSISNLKYRRTPKRNSTAATFVDGSDSTILSYV